MRWPEHSSRGRTKEESQGVGVLNLKSGGVVGYFCDFNDLNKEIITILKSLNTGIYPTTHLYCIPRSVLVVSPMLNFGPDAVGSWTVVT